MSKDFIEDFNIEQLREIFTKAGLNSDLTESAIKDYMRFREGELSSLSLLTYRELQALGADAIGNYIYDMRQGSDIINSILSEYTVYTRRKADIAGAYAESKDWDKVIISYVFSDSYDSMEAFIDYVEEVYQTKIKDGKHLQELTEVTKEPLEGLEEYILYSRVNKYKRAVKKTLIEGGSYNDLLNIDTKDFNLPEEWKANLYLTYSNNKEAIIGEIIAEEFLLGESFPIQPGLRNIAKELQAPYEAILKSWDRANLIRSR